MFDKIKEKRRRKKERKKLRPGRLQVLTANEKPIRAINIHIYMEGEDGIFRITTPEECPDLHYDELDFRAETQDKNMKIHGRFRTASQEKRFYVYDFLIEDYREFFA